MKRHRAADNVLLAEIARSNNLGMCEGGGDAMSGGRCELRLCLCRYVGAWCLAHT